MQLQKVRGLSTGADDGYWCSTGGVENGPLVLIMEAAHREGNEWERASLSHQIKSRVGL